MFLPSVNLLPRTGDCNCNICWCIRSGMLGTQGWSRVSIQCFSGYFRVLLDNAVGLVFVTILN